MSTIVYMYSFKLPCRKTADAKTSENDKKRGRRSSIKDLVTTDSYPSISVNINQYIQFANEKYIECSADAARSEKRPSSSSRGSFRTRNKFMIARNMFCRLVKHEKSLTSTEVSKIVSIVWKNSSELLQEYFEYLSTLETYWYDHLMSSYGHASRRRSTSPCSGTSALSAPYQSLCASSYTRRATKKPKNISPKSTSKFRVHKNIKVERKPTIYTPPALAKYHDNFFFNDSLITSTFGIVTEDIFFNS
ncbi:Piso0_005483 [Millerozyma farinosa CBS 7064]|uniref:Piso0_005483 protein n=1 Tax=Pichia sorbitophila (strain ATCC MYA-4447 / BCRC 22081 / CBS 7064 / NBRC 10061 / NRRL Y-12695) TaxID=559304 RepID=G8XZ50_PICSO|nr:Piso0_005483 [Millerozyma farinosa CBS 7064]